MIQIANLSKKYKTIEAVNIPELIIPQGESFGLVGNNGAGKTTLFRMVLDLIRPSSGEVLMKDKVVKGNHFWKEFTGSYLDEGFLIGFLTPDEYFDFVGNLNGFNKAETKERLIGFEEIFNGEILGSDKYIRDLSKGNQKKVGIAAAMLSNPEILILDEPFANLDPSTQIRLKNKLRNFQKENGCTLFISSHDLNHVTEVCERIVVLEKGQIIKDIKTSESTLKDLETYFAA
ncbi:ABC transporter ATP-binding protein [Chondrinema litorale]|uniref:ABC transporter ATP-binding protein n=1 Tax=Chondrinema litorale TaxID=2994555 RepID=UPI0025437484|nr:ABC transporter ATP-binding protein [Chondrinema litorale]UZR96056.1 ABC transporter ATP-binding protein [Chondrinema litorale]